MVVLNSILPSYHIPYFVYGRRRHREGGVCRNTQISALRPLRMMMPRVMNFGKTSLVLSASHPPGQCGVNGHLASARCDIPDPSVSAVFPPCIFLIAVVICSDAYGLLLGRRRGRLEYVWREGGIPTSANRRVKISECSWRKTRRWPWGRVGAYKSLLLLISGPGIPLPHWEKRRPLYVFATRRRLGDVTDDAVLVVRRMAFRRKGPPPPLNTLGVPFFNIS